MLLFLFSFLLPLATSIPTTLTGLTLNQTTNELITTTSQCGFNSPSNRQCWTPGHSLFDDFDKINPITGQTVTYDLTITNTTCNPDGHGAIECLLVNEQYPGPTLRANWGDNMIVNVHNALQDNGTTIHFHGVRQYHTPGSDGVPGLTECPLAPGQTRTYAFNVTQFGSSWYHSHFSSQYGSGVVGTIVFEGPASANYDVDLGVYPLNEWYYVGAWPENALAYEALQEFRGPPNPDNLLINGTNKDADGNGQYSQVTITKGKTYRLRLISIALDNYIRVSLDNHKMLIIAADFVPIKPITAEWILLGAGQRYDVVLTANQSPGSYWFRSEVATECLSANNYHGRAIWTYSSVTPTTPSSTPFPEPSDRLEPSPLTPFWFQPVPYQPALGTMNVDLTRSVITPDGSSLVVWALNRSIDVSWMYPTMSYLLNGSITDQNLNTYPFPQNLNVVPASRERMWNYWLIQQSDDEAVEPAQAASVLERIVHPIHLHGHDFYVLGQGTNETYSGTSQLNFLTPTRRDTASLYGNGWLAIAFESNNPGPWLMHCHIAWHISEGLGMQFLEAPSEVTLPNQQAYEQECQAWDDYYATAYYKKTDSGL